MSDRLEVGPAADFEAGSRRFLSADETEIAVLNVDGEYFAFENSCCHDGGPVCTGRVRPKLEGRYSGIGEHVDEFFGDQITITCPWHGWEYYLRSGEHVADDSISLNKFEVIEERGTLYVDL